MSIDDYRNQSVSMRGSAAFAEQRDNVQNPFLNDKSLFFARVTVVDQARRTISCVGLNSRFAHGPWDNVPVISMSATQREGSTWLPTIAPPAGETPATQARLDGNRDAIAVITFVEGNPNLPICIGFIFPGPNELSIPGMNINRYASNVYEAFSLGGEYEMVFPDGTFMKIATVSSPDLPINLTSTNLDAYTNPWSIDRDVDRKILLSHSGGNKIRISGDGVELQSYKIENFGLNPPTLAASSILDSLGNYTLGAKVANLTAPNINATGNVSVIGNLYLNGTSIDTLISNKVHSMFGSDNGGGGGSTTIVISQSSIADGSIALAKLASNISSLFTGSTTLTINPSAIADGSLSLSKLDTVVATYAQLISSSSQLYSSINTLQTSTESNLLAATNSLQASIGTVAANLSTHIANTNTHVQLGTTHTTAAYGDHTHDPYTQNGSVTYATGTDILLVSSTSNAAGSSLTVARGDHAHGLNIVALSATPGNITIGAIASTGTSMTAFARADHVHGTPSAWTPATHAHTGLSNISNAINLNSDGTMDITGSAINLTGTLNINGTSLQNIIRANQTDQSYLLYATTNDAINRTYLTTGGGTHVTSILSGTNHVVVSSNQVWAFVVDVVANAQAGTSGGRWTISGVLKRGVTIASTQFIGSPMATTVSVDSEFSSAAVYVDIENSSFGSLIVSVIGIANTAITWSAVTTIKGAYNNASSTAYSSYPIQSIPPVSASTSYDFTTYMLQVSTTSNEIATMTMDGLAVSSNNMPVLANGSAWFVKMIIMANASGISAGAWTISGIYRRALGPGTITFVGPLTYEQLTDTALNNASVTADVNTYLGSVSISVLGATNTSIKWLSVIEATEIS